MEVIMKAIVRFVLALSVTLLFLSRYQASGQTDSCGFDDSQQVPLTQEGGYQITSTGTVKALLVLIDFPDDTQDPNNPTWPVGVGPNYLNEIVDLTETQNSGLKYNITTFFRKMSYDQFTMIGKAYYQQAPQALSWYLTNHPGYEADYAARDAIQLLDAQIDFSDFDRWIYNGPFSHTPGTDGDLDMVFICFRRWYQGTSFIAQGWYPAYIPGNDISVDEGRRHIVANQAVDVLEMMQYPRLDILVHEFGHVWGLPHNYSGGLWSLMGHRHPNVSYFMNSYEREQLGWISFNNVTVDGTTDVISDFGTTGDAYRITIPGTTESFLIENHQQITLYDTVDLSANTGPGLYILQQSSADELRVAAADGRWNWSNPYWIQNLFNPGNPLDSIPVFKRETANRALGETDKVDHITTKGNRYLTFAWLDEQTGALKTGQRYMGDGKDRFTFADNNVFSPWSAYAAYNWGGTSATTIGLEITGTSGTNINVKFYTSNPINASPSKPQDLRVDLVEGSGHQNPRLTWALVQEPDVVNNGYILIERRFKPYGGSWSNWTEVASLLGGSVTEWIDEGVEYHTVDLGDTVQYRIRTKDTQQLTSNYSDLVSLEGYFKFGKPTAEDNVPSSFGLYQCYPNPFNPMTTISFDLPSDEFVTLKIFDVLGREIQTLVNEFKKAGNHQVVFDASGIATGVYIYKLQAGNFIATKKMLLAR
jgi:M6 family metalloprotease-like protein